MIKKIPFHIWLLASYFPLALLATNVAELKQITIVRLIAVTLLVAAALFFILNLIIRNFQKTGLVTSCLIILLSSYGLVYAFFKSPSVFFGSLGHHRIIAALLMVIAGLAIWATLKKVRHLPEVTLVVNLFAFYLLFMPLFQIGSFTLQKREEANNADMQVQLSAKKAVSIENLPDIYYIILDSYGRQDYLESDFQYDNSDFLSFMEDTGFYVAECSRSNYAHTFLSLSSTLNMTYIQDLLTADSLTENALKEYLVHSRFREKMNAMGYQIVSFDNVHWDFSDADVFYEFEIDPLLNPYLFPVESAYINNTIVKLARDLNPLFANKIHLLESSAVKDHFLQQEYILDSLDASTSLDSPKFVFAHVEKPHGPYVFEPNGEFIQEDAFYRDKYFAAINKDFDRLGYVKQIAYLNRRMIRFVENLLQKSNGEAIIIIQGDHGILETEDLNGRLAILNAVYFPGQDYTQFYSSITPVNTFRIIQDQFFGGNLGLLEDRSFYSYREDKLEYFPVKENKPKCLRYQAGLQNTIDKYLHLNASVCYQGCISSFRVINC